MSLSSKDKGLVKVGWAMVQRRSEAVGIEAISRMFFTLPQTKSYFAHWGGDLSPKSPHVKKQANKIMNAITSAVANMDTLDEDMLALSEQHAFQLRVDPVNFKFLIFNLHLTIAKSFPDEFTPVMHLALDKFLNLVALALSDKYR